MHLTSVVGHHGRCPSYVGAPPRPSAADPSSPHVHKRDHAMTSRSANRLAMPSHSSDHWYGTVYDVSSRI
jgi:hypothetical protein